MGAYTTAVFADSPVAYWRLDETSGSTVNDITGNGNIATVKIGGGPNGVPTWGVTGALVQSGDSDTAASFDGTMGPQTNGTMTFADVLSAECWVKRTRTGTQDWLIAHNNSASTWALSINASNQLQFEGNFTALATSTVTITDTVYWHHVVATKNGATRHVYLDGIDVTTGGSNATIASNANVIYLANKSASSYAPLSLDEVAVYTTELSAARVLAHYVAAATTQISGPGGPVARRFA